MKRQFSVSIALLFIVVLTLAVTPLGASSASFARLSDSFGAAARGADDVAGAAGRSSSSSGGSGGYYSGGVTPPHGATPGGRSDELFIRNGDGSYTHVINGTTNTIRPPASADNPLTVDYSGRKAQRQQDLAAQAERTNAQRLADNERFRIKQQQDQDLATQKKADQQRQQAKSADQHAQQQRKAEIDKSPRADYIVTSGGKPVPTNQAAARQGFERAGLPQEPTRRPGTEFTMPDGMKVRLMEPNGPNGRRASFTNANGQPVSPDGKPVNPPKGTLDPKKYVKERTHVNQD
jgi:hypothetical protein